MRRFARHIPKPDRIGVADARAQLARLLAGCTDSALAGFTAEKLASTHRVGVREAEYALIIARQHREAGHG